MVQHYIGFGFGFGSLIVAQPKPDGIPVRPRAETIPARAHTAPSTVSTPSRPRAALEHSPLARAIHPSRPSARAARALAEPVAPLAPPLPHRRPPRSDERSRRRPRAFVRLLLGARSSSNSNSNAVVARASSSRAESTTHRALEPPRVCARARHDARHDADRRARHDDASRARRVAECAARVVAERARADARIPKP